MASGRAPAKRSICAHACEPPDAGNTEPVVIDRLTGEIRDAWKRDKYLPLSLGERDLINVRCIPKSGQIADTAPSPKSAQQRK